MNANDLLARRHGPSQRMTIPVDPDTTRRLEAVIALRLDVDSGLLVQVQDDDADDKSDY